MGTLVVLTVYTREREQGRSGVGHRLQKEVQERT